MLAMRNRIKGKVNTCLFTGPNGNKVFFPAGGEMLYNSVSESGTSGSYWSSTSWGQAGAYGIYFNANGAFTMARSRCDGLMIRPVSF